MSIQRLWPFILQQGLSRLSSPAEAAGSSGLSTVQFASFEEHTSTPVPGTCLPLTLQTVDTSERITPLTADTVQLATGIYLVHFLVSGTLAEAGISGDHAGHRRYGPV